MVHRDLFHAALDTGCELNLAFFLGMCGPAEVLFEQALCILNSLVSQLAVILWSDEKFNMVIVET